MEILIKTTDGELINGTLYSSKIRLGVIIIAPAMGVGQSYYRHAAKFFQNLGYIVLTFDYTGIGKSRKLNDPDNCTLSSWASRDLSTVIDYTSRNYSDQPVYLLGHSISGQLFPLVKNRHLISKAYFVATQNTSKVNWSGKHKLVILFFWYLIVPLFNNLFNGLPGFAFGGNQKLPKGVASEWASWGRSENGAIQIESNRLKYSTISIPIKFVSFEDDELLAPYQAVRNIVESYGSSKKVHQHFVPKEFGLNSIGHFGFFRKTYQQFWLDVSNWFIGK